MYVFDTNVISEVMKDVPDARVTAGCAPARSRQLFTTAVAQSEILYGVRRLPEGQRRHRLSAAATAMFAEAFAGRILPFDAAAASAYADIRIVRERAGAPVGHEKRDDRRDPRAAGATVLPREAGVRPADLPRPPT